MKKLSQSGELNEDTMLSIRPPAVCLRKPAIGSFAVDNLLRC